MKEEGNKGVVVSEDIQSLINVLNAEDAERVVSLTDELRDNWKKKQIFRTDTEMRVSVLNEFKHGTRASKYWQAVREMSSMFNGLMEVHFELKRNNIARLQIEKKLQRSDLNKIKRMKLEVDLEENLYRKATMDQVASDRIRELVNWSEIKAELDDGSFDTTNPNTHQPESYGVYFGHRARALSANSDTSEIINGQGLYTTLKKWKDPERGSLLRFNEQGKLEGRRQEQPKLQ